MSDLAPRVAAILSLPLPAVTAALALLDEGATVPFVARYRKERTGGLDEVQLRDIAAQAERLGELDARRAAIVAGLREQGKWTDALQAALDGCATKAELEEIWAPFKKKRATRADQARARGLQPLADRVLAQPPKGDPLGEAAAYVSEEVADAAAALAGARDIVAEHIASTPEIVSLIRAGLREHGVVTTAAKKGATDERFRDYADHEEPIAKMPGHRWLAACRGEEEGALTLKVRINPERAAENVLRRLPYRAGSPYGVELKAACEDAVDRLLIPSAERAIRAEKSLAAEDGALDVFQRNLEAILLAAPLGPQGVLGIDPGLRTGCKCALVSDTGALIEHHVLPLVHGSNKDLVAWLRRARPRAVAVGNGTGGREALAAARDAAREAGGEAVVVSVSEAGASVYSASDAARDEMPDVDLTVRSAVHIARRLQDPLAELVKVPPQALGVGQYQHDVDEGRLTRRLHDVVESCVNRVGVDVNTASPALLSYVAGIGPKLAAAIVRHRQERGPFPTRRALREVAGLGPKTFEQCAGFLRVRGDEPLDASAVHPERYALVAKMAKELGLAVKELVGNAAAVKQIALSRYQDADTGLATLKDIAEELLRPGRDPRAAFEAPAFRDDVREIGDLQVGMVLHGVVTNVTAFGAFVDVGVHQDGLVHVSELADRFVRDPHEVVKPGQPIEVRVTAIDAARQRISLSAKKART